MKRLLFLICIVALLITLVPAKSALSIPPWPPADDGPGCPKYKHTFYLPLITQQVNPMIISRFGADRSTAYQFPTYKGEDDYQVARPASAAQVGGMGGAFDFWGQDANPIAPQTVVKRFDLLGVHSYAGTGTVYTHKTYPLDIYDIFGSGTTFLTDFVTGDKVRFTFGGTTYIFTIGSVIGDTHMTVVSGEIALLATLDCQVGDAVSYTVIKTAGNLNYNYLDEALDELKLATVNAGESKLWALRRDASYLWAWAKLVRGKWPETYQTKLHIPVELEFFLREGLWYGETYHTSGNITTSSPPYEQDTNAGSLPANVLVTITPTTGTLTAVTLTNVTNSDTFTWTGSLAATKVLTVDSGIWAVRADGVGAYSGLTYGSGQKTFMQMEPGSNAFSISVTGATAWTATVQWYDTYPG